MRVFNYDIQIRKIEPPNITGVQSWVSREKNEHIILLDYDNAHIEEVRGDIELLINKYRLGSFYLFETAKGYHAYSLEPRPFWDVVSILNDSKGDKAHLKAPFYKNNESCWTLRVSLKNGNVPLWVETIPGFETKVSVKHYEFLKNVMGAPMEGYSEGVNGSICFVGYSQPGGNRPL